MRSGLFFVGLIALPLAQTTARAANGAQFVGNGVKATGMGGVSIALPQDAIAATNNPAGITMLGDRYDFDIQTVYTHADADLPDRSRNASVVVPFPEGGWVRRVNDKLSVSISTAGAGAGFKYREQIYPGLTGKPSGAFQSLNILTTLAWRSVPNLSIGGSLVGGFQRFSIRNSPGTSNHGFRNAFGAGWKVGILWQPRSFLSLGAMYSSKISFGAFSDYKNDILSTVGGKIDTPERYGAGVAVGIVPKLTLAADYLHIAHGKTQLGTLFNWRSQNVAKFGASYDISKRWTGRVGASFTRRHLTPNDLAANLIIPAINSNTVSTGATYRLDDKSEISAGIENDFGGRMVGTGPSTGTSLKSTFIIVSIGYGHRF